MKLIYRNYLINPIDKMKRFIIYILMAMTINASAQDVLDTRTEEKWDKVFPLSETVNHQKVEFKNQYLLSTGKCKISYLTKENIFRRIKI